MTTAIRAPFMDVHHSQTTNNNNGNTVYQQSPGKRKRGPDLDLSTNNTTATKNTGRIITAGFHRRPSDAAESVEANSPSARVEGRFRKLRLQSPVEGINGRDGGVVMIQSSGASESADVDSGVEVSDTERHRHTRDENGDGSGRSEMMPLAKRSKATMGTSPYESADKRLMPGSTATTTMTTMKSSSQHIPAFTFESDKLDFSTSASISTSTPTSDTTQAPPALSPPYSNPQSSPSSAAIQALSNQSPPPSSSSSPNSNTNSNPILNPSSSQFWQPSEITGWTPDDPDEDNYGVNGVGYHKTPALAYSLSQRRKRQIAEYRSRESQEARRRRGEKRRFNSGVGNGSGKEDDNDQEEKGAGNKSKRLVRFEDG